MTEEFEEVRVLGKPAILTSERIAGDTIPQGYYMYELRNDRIFRDDPIELSRCVVFNHWGTVITRDEIRIPPGGTLYMKQGALEFDTGDCQGMKEYMDRYPPRVRPPVDHER